MFLGMTHERLTITISNLRVPDLQEYTYIPIQGDPDHPEAMFFSETVSPIEMR